jgi:small-conductance mechanosensitive channel
MVVRATRGSGLPDWLNTIDFTTTVWMKAFASIVTIVAVTVVRWLVMRSVIHRVEDTELVFRLRKATTYVATAIIIVALVFIWVDAFGDLGTVLGLLSAGIAIALADVFLNMAGWVYLVLRRPFRVGDRIQMGEHAGDVVDIRLFRFTVLEIGNWVAADQSTGRLVHIPNGKIFREPEASYTEAFAQVWHEIEVLITFESDWERMEVIMRGILAHHATSVESAAASEVRKASRQYLIRYRELGPNVYLTTRDSGILLTGRLLVHSRERRGLDDAVWRELLTALAAEPGIDLAYPTYRVVGHGPPAPPVH